MWKELNFGHRVSGVTGEDLLGTFNSSGMVKVLGIILLYVYAISLLEGLRWNHLISQTAALEMRNRKCPPGTVLVYPLLQFVARADLFGHIVSSKPSPIWPFSLKLNILTKALPR